jgi:hypothetical protein
MVLLANLSQQDRTLPTAELVDRAVKLCSLSEVVKELMIS